MRDRNEHPADPSRWPEFYPPQRPADQTRYLPELPDEPPDATRTAGLKRLSRLTWHVTQLGAITAVGFATVFARTAPAQTVSSHAAPAVSATTTTPTPTVSPPKTQRKHHTAGARRPGQSQGQPTAQPGNQPAAKATKSAGAAPKPALSPPTTAPAAAPPPPPSSAPAPAPTVSSTSAGHGG
jgi:hypothetical protein